MKTYLQSYRKPSGSAKAKWSDVFSGSWALDAAKSSTFDAAKRKKQSFLEGLGQRRSLAFEIKIARIN